MKIKVVSDLHLEFSPIEINNDENCDILILAGDIVTAQDLHDYPVVSEYSKQPLGSRQILAARYRDFFSSVTSKFKEVIYVPGNHEYYKSKWYAGTTYLEDECAKYSNLYFLEDRSVVLGGIAFIGGALWTDMNKQDPVTLAYIKDVMNDFKLIRNDKRSYTALRPIDTVKRHQKTLAAFDTLLNEYKDKKCIVISHHGPSLLSIHEKYKADTTTNGAFTSDLSEFILDRPQITQWIHGHTHSEFDYMLGDTRVICNPRGYVMEQYSSGTYVENPNWSADKIITL